MNAEEHETTRRLTSADRMAIAIGCVDSGRADNPEVVDRASCNSYQ
jgi:hypothetical protein